MKINPIVPRKSYQRKGQTILHRATKAHNEESVNILQLKYKGEWMLDPVTNLLAHLMTSVPFFNEAFTEAQYRVRK